MINKQLFRSILAVGILSASTVASTAVQAAPVAFNNITAASSGVLGVAPTVGPLAESFTATVTGNPLIDVKLLLRKTANTGSISVDLFSNAANTPGALIANIGTVSDSLLSATLSQVDFQTLVALTAGTRYWIRVSSSDGSSAQWSFSVDMSGAGNIGNEYTYFSGTAGNNTNDVGAALQMQVTVPEPATLALMSLGLVGIGFGKRRKSF